MATVAVATVALVAVVAVATLAVDNLSAEPHTRRPSRTHDWVLALGFHFLILSSKVFIKFGLAYAWLDRCDPQSACTLSTLPVAGTRVLKDLPALVSIVVNDGVERAGESMKENDEIAL